MEARLYQLISRVNKAMDYKYDDEQTQYDTEKTQYTDEKTQYDNDEPTRYIMNEPVPEYESELPPPPLPRVRNRNRVTFIVCLVAVVILSICVGGIFWWKSVNEIESTTDAQTKIEQFSSDMAAGNVSDLPSVFVLEESGDGEDHSRLELEINGANVTGVWHTRIASLKMKGTVSGSHLSLRGRVSSARLELNKMSDGSFHGTYAGPDQELKEVTFLQKK